LASYNYNDFVSFPIIGADCIKKFWIQLKAKTIAIFYKVWRNSKNSIHDLNICEEDNQINGKCCACDDYIFNDDREKYFNQFTGKYVGPIHKACKLTYVLTDPFFPVIFESLSRSDIYLLVTELGKELKPTPSNTDMYSGLTYVIRTNFKLKYELQFMNSNRFLNISFKKLATFMDKAQFKNFNLKFQGHKFEHVPTKLKFPHYYLDSISKLNETCLPHLHKFTNPLNQKTLSVEDYNYAQEVWNKFECRSISEFLELYMKSKILILADVFEHFRSVCLKIYKLDPINYIDASTMSWDAMLKCTKIQLDLIGDPDKSRFFQSATRASLVKFTPSISIANNKYLESFDPHKPLNFLAHLEAEGLYDWAMCQPLPFSNFSFLSSSQIAMLDVRNITPNGDLGYMLEVDLKYPAYLHRRHQCLPFCPEKINSKLITDVTDKSNYVIHLKHLQLCLDHGLILTKIHRVLVFNQSCWLKPYVELNLNGRKLAQSEFESHFFKLMNQVVLEKLMTTVENKNDVVFVSHYQSRQKSAGFRQRIARDNFHSVKIIGPNLAAIESTIDISYGKFLFIGACVSELSKWLMYEHFHNFLYVKCPSLKLLYMDTNFFVISSEYDIYKLIKENPNYFDTVNYKSNNVCRILQPNNIKIGILKNKNGSRIMTLFVALRERGYTILVE